MWWWRHYSGLWLFETRNRQGIWEVTLYHLLSQVLRCFNDAKRQHLSTNNTDSDLSFTTIPEQTYRRKQSMGQSDDNSLTALLAEKSTSRTPQGRKYMHSEAGRKTHSTNGVNIKSRVTYNAVRTCERFVPSWMAQWAVYYKQCIGSSPYVLVHVVGPLAATVSWKNQVSSKTPLVS